MTGIAGVPEVEANDILERLLTHVVQPQNVYEHEWQPGDLVLWDNAVVLHARDTFPDDENRLVKRMLIKLDPAKHIIPPAIH